MNLGLDTVLTASTLQIFHQLNLDTAGIPRTPFLMAAWNRASTGEPCRPGAHFNGKIDSPRLAGRAMDRLEMGVLLQRPDADEFSESLVAAWDLSRDIPSEHVADLSPNGLHGETYQLPTRAVTGYRWTGAYHDWRSKPEHYSAIHFHDDDLYDAEWETSFELTIPEDMRSGVYAARLRTESSEDYVPFFVRPPRGKATAKVALLASTATYMSYANTHLGVESPAYEMMRGRLPVVMPETVFLMEHPEYGYSQYDHHSDGSGVCYSSRLRPILNMGSKSELWSFNADTHITDWLENKGISYDVLTDEDLHQEGAGLLGLYSVVMTGAHPEYYSTQMLDGVEEYLLGGGRFMYMGGNGFYWRIAYHSEKPGVIEVRRAEDGTRAWKAPPGEYYHSFTGEHGGLWSRQARPPNLLVGIGFTAQGFDSSSYYRRQPGSHDPRAAFVFKGVDDEIIGDFGSIGGGAAGSEIDRYDRHVDSAPDVLVLLSSENHSAHYLKTKEELFSSTLAISGLENPRVRSDVVFFECPGGGAVFSTGSITWSASLAHNEYSNNVSRVTENVLRRFMDGKPFELAGR